MAKNKPKVHLLQIGKYYFVRLNGSIVLSSKTEDYKKAKENFNFVVDWINPTIMLSN